MQDSGMKNLPPAPNSVKGRARLASRMTPLLRMESRDLTASFASSVTESLEDERAAARGGPRVDLRCSAPPGIGISAADAAKLVAEEYFSGEQDPEAAPLPSLPTWEDSASASSKSSDSTPSLGGALALEVGLIAQEYLEECFHVTEVSVLDKDKFDAVPEIFKEDFAVLGHLGKGSFSDVFEVVRKDGGLPDEPNVGGGCNTSRLGRCLPSRRRRATLSRSISTATLTRPPLGNKGPSFALKCLRPQIRSDAEQFAIGAEDLVHETAMLASLSHPHIITLHGRASGDLEEAFVLNDGYFILMEKLTDTLPDRIERWRGDPESQGPTPEKLRVVRDVADAMSYLHSKRIIFRDLKPANVGFDDGVVKLFDFGFAAGLPVRDETNPDGLIFEQCGTPRYMAPEVGLGLGYGLKADVYSLGVLLWEACAASKPFAHIVTPEDFDARVFVGGERPGIEPHWPAAAGGIMARCWSTDPGERPLMLQVRSQLSSAIKRAEESWSPANAPSVRSNIYPVVLHVNLMAQIS